MCLPRSNPTSSSSSEIRDSEIEIPCFKPYFIITPYVCLVSPSTCFSNSTNLFRISLLRNRKSGIRIGILSLSDVDLIWVSRIWIVTKDLL